ncbi:MAG: hypothetical protein A2020_10045 [Lentisphaerae bacterium GWF2_45_14]|nr:MAG: hypothetical protein A2020_10045 [Lentisphaerae bacterium GWF2_45_14]
MAAAVPGTLRYILKRILCGKISCAAFIIVVLYLLLSCGMEIYAYHCAYSGIDPIYAKGNMSMNFLPPSAEHWFGTDYQGRDVFWRSLAGAGTAVKIGMSASIISAVIGVILGMLAGYFGKWVDDLVVWIYSTFASMPTLLFILAFALLVSKGFLFPPAAELLKKFANVFHADMGMIAVYLGIGLTGWVGLCQVVRAETMKLRETGYVLAAKSMGFNPFKIIFRHIMPNLFHLVIIYFTMRFAYSVMTEVIVSYLGLGVESAPSWGVMISDGQEGLWRGLWWEVTAATALMFFMVLPLHLLGDYLRDILDPRLGEN